MPEPVDFLVVTNLQTALRAIAVASGYHYDVTSAAVKLDPNQAVEDLVRPDGLRPFVLLEPKPATWDYGFDRQVTRWVPLTIHWVHDADPTDDTSRLKTFYRGCADVEKAVAADLTRGGYGKDTQIVEQVYDEGRDGSQVWARTEVRVLLERQFGSPNA